MATSVAHDINNPLTVIKNTAILLQDEYPDDQSLNKDMQRVVHHANRCSRTVDNLLRFGRPLNLKYEEFELGKFLRNYIEDYQDRINNLPYQITGDSDVLVQGDRYQIEQLLDNLINNAYEANDNKKIIIQFGTAGEKTIFISIIDHGMGFPQEIVSSGFSPFYSTKTGGTGLGLSNSKAIAHAHGGDIAITNAELGQITVTLPIAINTTL